MKRSILVPILFGSALFGQAPAGMKPETVIATIDGKPLTYAEIEGYLDALGPERKAAALASPKELIAQYAFQQRLVQMAEKEKLDQISPYKEALEVSRRALLTEAELNNKSLHLLVTADDQKKFYESHKDRYTEVKLQVIYLGFTSDEVAKENPKKYRNEAQTLALAVKLRGEAKTNSDFIRLAKQYSDDETSKAKDGEYGSLKMSDNVPAEIKQVVFALKQDEVTQPVKQQNGYYLFRAQSVGLLPYDTVKDNIYTELKDAGMKQWMSELQKSIAIKQESPAFFTPPQTPKQ